MRIEEFSEVVNARPSEVRKEFFKYCDPIWLGILKLFRLGFTEEEVRCFVGHKLDIACKFERQERKFGEEEE